MRKGYVIGAIALLLALGVGWYLGSPKWTLYQMREAAQDGDTDKLAEYIDFPALRASLKEEMKASAAAEMQKPENKDGFAALGMAFGMTMIDNMVDGMVTPTAMRKVFLANKDKGPPAVTKVDGSREDVAIERHGMDRFFVRNDAASSSAALIFTRHGLGWQLSGMRLPE
ncbi:DUF2939 domain-containing protein [Sphingomonas oligophenolica]|uniref:DUF2939 domain-containing protein n=1 Tax=Sphingomonas oligophenolica TaxID=301154 RepID=A0A502CRP1_9SPHN|nr:DUF2939 domain-containing protein [Sphingomonas oligophenolica]TPG14381.1 DUF2939 domain-containing protein [Sphingomonas oligophenolica]